MNRIILTGPFVWIVIHYAVPWAYVKFCTPAGFIGFHMTKKLLNQGWNVTGIDNLNPYYDVSCDIILS